MKLNEKMPLKNNVKLRKKILNETAKIDKSNYKEKYLEENYPYVYDGAKKEFSSSLIIESLSDTLLYFNVLTGDIKKSRKYLRKIYDLLIRTQTPKDLHEIIFKHKKRIIAKIRAEKYENQINKDFIGLKDDSNQTDKIKTKIQHLLNEFYKKNGNHKIEKIEEMSANLSFIARTLLYKRSQNLESNRDVEWSHHFNSEYWFKQGYSIGYIYILSNLYMPGLVKIGVTGNEAIKRANELSRGKLEKDKILNFFLKEYEYIKYPEIIATTLSRVTGVPGDFNLEYYRKTLIKFPIGKNNASIQKVIHNDLINSLQNEHDLFDENFNYDLYHKEFFTVPSTKYAILFVEKMLDRFDFTLKQLELKSIPCDTES